MSAGDLGQRCKRCRAHRQGDEARRHETTEKKGRPPQAPDHLRQRRQRAGVLPRQGHARGVPEMPDHRRRRDAGRHDRLLHVELGVRRLHAQHQGGPGLHVHGRGLQQEQDAAIHRPGRGRPEDHGRLLPQERHRDLLVDADERHARRVGRVVLAVPVPQTQEGPPRVAGGQQGQASQVRRMVGRGFLASPDPRPGVRICRRGLPELRRGRCDARFPPASALLQVSRVGPAGRTRRAGQATPRPWGWTSSVG